MEKTLQEFFAEYAPAFDKEMASLRAELEALKSASGPENVALQQKVAELTNALNAKNAECDQLIAQLSQQSAVTVDPTIQQRLTSLEQAYAAKTTECDQLRHDLDASNYYYQQSLSSLTSAHEPAISKIVDNVVNIMIANNMTKEQFMTAYVNALKQKEQASK